MRAREVDPRSRRFVTGLLVAWAVLPLLGGLAGLWAAFQGLTLPYVKDDFGQLVGCGTAGCLVGAFLATVHTVWSYWRTYLR